MNEKQKMSRWNFLKLTDHTRFLASCKADGVWRRQSPIEVSPFAEHRGQPPHHAPLQERAFRRLRLHQLHAAEGHQSSLLRLEQADVWEGHTTWTTRATRRLQGADEATVGEIFLFFTGQIGLKSANCTAGCDFTPIGTKRFPSSTDSIQKIMYAWLETTWDGEVAGSTSKIWRIWTAVQNQTETLKHCSALCLFWSTQCFSRRTLTGITQCILRWSMLANQKAGGFLMDFESFKAMNMHKWVAWNRCEQQERWTKQRSGQGHGVRRQRSRLRRFKCWAFPMQRRQ